MRCFLGLSLVFLGCRTVDKGFDTGGLGDGGDAQVDVDGDGFSAAEDCDDNDASVFPGATEVCDGVDNNCENGVDEGVASTWYTDEDGDGFGNPYDSSEACDQPAGAVPSGTDCDDADPDVYPSAPEVCNGLDDNCDGQSDEGLSSRWYPDDDTDGFGDTERGEDLCDTPLGWVQVAGDCDDGDMSVFPGAAEVCDEVDQDCDGAVDRRRRHSLLV